MSKTILFKDEDDLKKYIINFIKNDPAFVQELPTLSKVIIEGGIVIPSFKQWELEIEGRMLSEQPIRIDNSNYVKMYANELNVDRLFIGGKEIIVTEQTTQKFVQNDFPTWL